MAAATSGAFFVATGERYRQQTLGALQVLRQTNPNLAVTVFTDEVAPFAGVPGVDDVRAIAEPAHSYVDKLRGFLDPPYDRNVFLDTDTYVVSDVSDLFALLDRFELAACHAPGRSGNRFHPYEPADLPAAFPQLNTGVVAFRRSPRVHAVIQRWQEIYRANPNHLHDQPALREAVYRSDLQVCALPPEYNLLLGHAYLSGPLRILHAPTLSPDEALRFAAAINQRSGARVFVPPGQLFFL